MPKLELIFSSSSFKVISFSFSPATTFKGALSINLSFDNFFSMTISNSLIFVFLFSGTGVAAAWKGLSEGSFEGLFLAIIALVVTAGFRKK